MQLMLSNKNSVKKHGANNMLGHREMINGVVSKPSLLVHLLVYEKLIIIAWKSHVIYPL